MDGFLLIDKPSGITSHDVVYQIKKKFKLKKIGHTGTLDPFATGLLILCIGKATKLSDYISNQSKSYEGTIVFGDLYDTYDITGTVIKSSESHLEENDIVKAISSFIKPYQQVPPMYSAIKKDGKKAYQMAREGKTVEMTPRSVEIFDFKALSSYREQSIDFYAHVSKGTYIRSLAVDLGTQLNTYAALSRLNRLSIGSYQLDDAHDLNHVSLHHVIDLKVYLKSYQKLVLSDYLVHLVKHGVYLDERQIITDLPFVVYDEQEVMIAFYDVIEENKYKPVIIFEEIDA